MNLSIDQTFLQETLVNLVRINSTNPLLTPGSPGEVLAGQYIADAMASLGLDVTVHQLESNRVNVVAILKGSGGGQSLMLNGHLDTVGVDRMENPFSGTIREGKLYGRGSQDMKGSLAAIMAALKALVDANVSLGGDVIFTAVADEEHSSIGTEHIVKHYTADAAIVAEPTDMAVGLAHRGFIWYQVETFGRAAHGSRYSEGIDANMRMGRFLAELDKLEQELLQRPPHLLAGPPSLHASLISGGTELPVYAAHCLLQMERRTIPGEETTQATRELQNIIDKLAAADPTFKASLKSTFERAPFEISPNADIVRITDAAVAKRLGQPASHIGCTFWTDAALLAESGIDTLLLGPIGQGLHSAEEWVDLSSVLDLAYILADVAVAFCGLR